MCTSNQKILSYKLKVVMSYMFRRHMISILYVELINAFLSVIGTELQEMTLT